MLPWIQQLKKKKTAFQNAVSFGAVFFFFTFFVACLLFPVSSVLAQGDSFGLQPVERGLFLPSGDIRLIIARIINAVLGLLGIIAVVIIIYAGYVIMTAGGNEEKVTQGKRILVNAVIGLAIILSAFAIVQFILTRLGAATGVAGLPEGRRAAVRASFEGSGALGNIIADHYPFRDETDVRRNTRIAVTFREPIDPRSFIADTNGNGIFGDCRDPGARALDWATDCDQLQTDVVRIQPTEPAGPVAPAAALAVYEGAENQVFTVVFRPLSLLGSDIQPVRYAVDLTEDMLKADGQTSAFAADRDGHYRWDFETGTKIDTDPPTVVEVYPAPGATVPRNSIIQITFSEAMDPSVVQGRIGSGSSFSNIIFGAGDVSGNWRVTNAYRTVEFVSDAPCGQNSCGEEMYCLPPTPASCPAGSRCRAALVRTGQTVASTGFEGIPLTGVMDMAGNVLDGDGDGTPDGRPAIPPDPRTISTGEERPDNYLWEFTIGNTIDRTAPYIWLVLPGIDQEDVTEDADLKVTFSGRMWGATLRDISVVEHGLNLPFWYRVGFDTVRLDGADRTAADIDHRVFGPEGADVYYFPLIPSMVRSVTQNCLYPGRGPASNAKNTSPTCLYEEDANGNPLSGTGANCTPVTRRSDTDTGCVFTNVPNRETWLKMDLPACQTQLESVSPTQ